jgi:hypothetical protein
VIALNAMEETGRGADLTSLADLSRQKPKQKVPPNGKSD